MNSAGWSGLRQDPKLRSLGKVLRLISRWPSHKPDVRCSTLPPVKADPMPDARPPEPTKGAATTDQQMSNGRLRKPIADRTGDPTNSAPATLTSAPTPITKSRNMHKFKSTAPAVSPSDRTDMSTSHQPRENQAWINKMKRPPADGSYLRDTHTHAEDRKRRKAEQQDMAPVAGSVSRNIALHKLPQQEPLPREDSRNGAAQPLCPSQVMRHVPPRYCFSPAMYTQASNCFQAVA